MKDRDRIKHSRGRQLRSTGIVSRFHVWFMTCQSRRAAQTLNALPAGTFLELGCGHGWLSDELSKIGRKVVKSDFKPSVSDAIHVDAHDMLFSDQSFDCIICSNTLEHLHNPQTALKEMRRVGRQLWLTWTPWWSPFGGHDFAPWHYFGKTAGRQHQLGVNLYRTTVSETLRQLKAAGWTVDRIRPRYWPCFGFLAHWKLTREWATWNVEILCSANSMISPKSIAQSRSEPGCRQPRERKT